MWAACDDKRLMQLRMDTVSMVFQQFGLLPWRSVADNVGFGLEIAGIPEANARRRVTEQLRLSACPTGPTGWSPNFPAACSSASASPAPLPPARRSF
jgi:glycine betaine/proline transport system ATP-binding protein